MSWSLTLVVSGTNHGSLAEVMISSLLDVPAGARRARAADPWCAATPTIFSGSSFQSGTRVYCDARVVENLWRRLVGVDRLHLRPMNHDVGDLQIAEVEHAAQHVGIAAGDRAFLWPAARWCRGSPHARRECCASSSALPGVSFRNCRTMNSIATVNGFRM